MLCWMWPTPTIKMGMSTFVKGYRDPNGIYEKHVRVLEACREAGISLPKETALFFNCDHPDDVDPSEALRVKVPYKEVNPYDAAEGYEITLSELPKDVSRIVFINSW